MWKFRHSYKYWQDDFPLTRTHSKYLRHWKSLLHTHIRWPCWRPYVVLPVHDMERQRQLHRSRWRNKQPTKFGPSDSVYCINGRGSLLRNLLQIPILKAMLMFRLSLATTSGVDPAVWNARGSTLLRLFSLPRTEHAAAEDERHLLSHLLFKWLKMNQTYMSYITWSTLIFDSNQQTTLRINKN